MTPRRFLLDASLLAVGMLTAAGIGEALLRSFWPQRSDVTVGMFESDPQAGYRLRSHYSSEVRVPEYRTRIITDAEGYRTSDSETPLPDAVRLLAVGDSFTFGVGVDAEKAFPEQLEARLNAGSGSAWDVRNGGVGGYGPLRTARALRGRQAKWQPNVIVHAVYVGNDLEDSDPGALLQDTPVKDGRLITPGHHPLLQLRLALRTRSHLYTFLRQNLYGVYRASGLWQRSQYLDPIGLAVWPARVTEVTWPAGQAAIADIRDWAVEHDARYLVVVIPARWQVSDEAWDRYRKAWRKPNEEFDRGRAQREVFAVLEEMEIPAVNLLPALRRAETSGTRTYYRQDPHWTPAAHDLAAQLIHHKMADLGWLRGSASGDGQVARGGMPDTTG
jgi:hypothetical protein